MLMQLTQVTFERCFIERHHNSQAVTTLSCCLQIIDLGLAEDSASVLGAALHWQDGQDWLLVLIADQLLVHKITV